jgi:hypothetical protein
MLLDLVTVRPDAEMASSYLIRTDSGQWRSGVAKDVDGDADEVVGRIEQVEPFGPLTLVIDGHAVTWDKLGQALSSYEGWQFVLRIADPAGDPRR